MNPTNRYLKRVWLPAYTRAHRAKTYKDGKEYDLI